MRFLYLNVPNLIGEQFLDCELKAGCSLQVIHIMIPQKLLTAPLGREVYSFSCRLYQRIQLLLGLKDGVQWEQIQFWGRFHHSVL